MGRRVPTVCCRSVSPACRNRPKRCCSPTTSATGSSSPHLSSRPWSNIASTRRVNSHQALRSRGFIAASRDVLPIDLLAARLRTRKSLGEGPSLAIFVVTLRCGQSCHYCQVSRRRMAEPGFDMSAATMAQAVDRLFELPARQLTVEFQGGEPALAFDLVRRIVEAIVARNEHEGRRIRFTMVSTLEHLDREALRFCRGHGIALSTSLDGPAEIHDANRPHPNGASHARTRDALCVPGPCSATIGFRPWRPSPVAALRSPRPSLRLPRSRPALGVPPSPQPVRLRPPSMAPDRLHHGRIPGLLSPRARASHPAQSRRTPDRRGLYQPAIAPYPDPLSDRLHGSAISGRGGPWHPCLQL